jgi:hypothetical protein
MLIETNERLIHRNGLIAKYASILGMVVLLAGFLITIRWPELASISFATLIVGFLLSQVGIHYQNRWGRRPRPDELLNAALKGIGSKYALYHYTTPVSHLLIGPAGVWVLFPKAQRGVITFENGRWKQKGGGVLQAYLRLFAQEGLGRPDIEIGAEVESLRKYLAKLMPEESLPDIQAALIFMNAQAELRIDEDAELPIPTLYLNKLKELIKKTAKGKPISSDKVLELQKLLSTGNQTEEEEVEE